MKFAIVGLGRMGLSLGQRAVERGHEVIAWDPDESARKSAAEVRMHTVDELPDVPGALSAPRVVLMWVPQGEPVDANLEELLPRLGDVVADCGNSFWEETIAPYPTYALGLRMAAARLFGDFGGATWRPARPHG